MVFENYEEHDLMKCIVQSNNNSEIAAETYLRRYRERRRPSKSIFKILRENLVKCECFDKAKIYKIAKSQITKKM